MNIFKLRWVTTSTPKKGIWDIRPIISNLQLFAKKLEMGVITTGTEVKTFYRKVNNDTMYSGNMKLIEFSIENFIYMKFSSKDIGEFEILGM